MTIKVGDRMPEGSFNIMTKDGPGSLAASELFKGKKVLLFAVPGAFTPVCSMNHLPGYVEQAAALRAKGIDTIACMAVNDAFVMDAWAKDRKVGDKVLMLADGNASYTRALGLELDASGVGLGTRSQRFAVLVEDGVVRKLYIEETRALKVSSAEHVLKEL